MFNPTTMVYFLNTPVVKHWTDCDHMQVNEHSPIVQVFSEQLSFKVGHHT